MAHAPFFAAAGPQFFGQQDFLKLPNLKDLKALFEGPQYAKWQSFRESEDSRYVGLLMPRFLLRVALRARDRPGEVLQLHEETRRKARALPLGQRAFAFATRIADSFAKFRWCPNIIGPQAGGAVEDLPLHHYEAMGEIQTKIPTEVMISERREFELSEEGFIALTYRKDSDNAASSRPTAARSPSTSGSPRRAARPSSTTASARSSRTCSSSAGSRTT